MSGVKVPLGSKCPGVKVSQGSKCPWGQSVPGVKLGVIPTVGSYKLHEFCNVEGFFASNL